MDADHARSITNNRSMTGYCTFIQGNLVTWRNKNYLAVARLSTKSEFHAMALGIYELLWPKILLK